MAFLPGLNLNNVKRGGIAVFTGGISEIPGVKESVTGAFNQITGKAGATAARDAAETQVAASELAQAQLATRTAPFEQLGLQAGGQLIGSILGQRQPGIPLAATSGGLPDGVRAASGGHGFGGLVGRVAQQIIDSNPETQQLRSQEGISAPDLQNQITPQLQTADEVLSNPFFQALAQQQDEATINRRAAMGLGGSGGTEDSLRRQQLLLGNQFQQQDLQNQQLFRQNEQQNVSNRQQNFSNQMQQNQQRFTQLFNTTGLGANAAIGAGTQIANLQTGAGAAQAAGIVGAANARAGGFNNLLNIGGNIVSGLGGIGGMFGGGAAGGINTGLTGSILGGGSAVGSGFNSGGTIGNYGFN